MKKIDNGLIISLDLSKLNMLEFVEFREVVQRLFDLNLKLEIIPITPTLLKKNKKPKKKLK